MKRITIFNASTIFEQGFDTQLIVSYYDSEKQEFERLRTKISSNFVQDLASGFSNQDDVELLIENTDEGKENLTKSEIQEIYNELFIDNKKGHSTRYKISSDSENTIRAKNVFIHILREGKLKELGI